MVPGVTCITVSSKVLSASMTITWTERACELTVLTVLLLILVATLCIKAVIVTLAVIGRSLTKR